MPPPSLRTLVARLNALREADQRARALAAMLSSGDAGAWVEVLDALLARGAQGRDPAEQVAAGCVARAVAEDLLGYDARRELYVAARGAGAESLARLLLGASPGLDERALATALRPERALRPDGRALTLGERKALARSPRRDALLPLLADPHPDVVANLLANPRLTERDILAIASSRKVAPAALERLAQHPRWAPRLAVRRAVVLNPRTPLPCALRLAITLGRSDLAEVAAQGYLPAALRAHAEALRGQTGAAAPGAGEGDDRSAGQGDALGAPPPAAGE